MRKVGRLAKNKWMRASVLLVLLFVSNSIFSQDLMSEQAFTAHVKEKVSPSIKTLKVLVFDDLILGSKFNNDSFIHSLKEDYATYKVRPTKLDSIISEVNIRIDSIYAPDPNYKLNVAKILPLLMEKKSTMTLATNDGKAVPYNDYNNELVITYVEDKEKGYWGYRYFSEEELKSSGVSKDSLNAIAIKNLKTMATNYLDYRLQLQHYHMYRNVGDEGIADYLSSLILLPGFLDQEQNSLGQHLVIGIPKESQLIIVGKKNKAGLRELKTYAAQNYYIKEDHLLTKKLFLWDGKALTLFKK